MKVRDLIEALRRLPADRRDLDILAEADSFAFGIGVVDVRADLGAVFLRELPQAPPAPPPERVAGLTTPGGVTE